MGIKKISHPQNLLNFNDKNSANNKTSQYKNCIAIETLRHASVLHQGAPYSSYRLAGVCKCVCEQLRLPPVR